jgi:hypothetical protein
MSDNTKLWKNVRFSYSYDELTILTCPAPPVTERKCGYTAPKQLSSASELITAIFTVDMVFSYFYLVHDTLHSLSTASDSSQWFNTYIT